MPEQVAFSALIKLISVKSLVSGDKEGEIRLRFLPTDEMLDGLNRLHRADEESWIVLVPMAPSAKNRESNGDQAVPKREKRKPQG